MEAKIISREGQAVLVEWQDAVGVHRGVLPVSQVGDGSDIPYPQLQAAIPYGIPWEKIVLTPITTQQVAQAFRAKGIWTETDLQKKLPEARAALQELYGITLGFLLDAIRRNG